MTKPVERVTTASEGPEDALLDRTLRPKTLKEYIGQQRMKENLTIALSASKKRKEPVEHVLLHGAPGLGKTTLAHVIAHELGADIRVTSGPAIERAGDLAAILTNLAPGDVLFIDEIHRLNRTVEEVLYPAMEEFALDLVVGKGPAARTLRLDLPRFTLVGATTRVSLLSGPLRDRFGLTYRIDFYDDEDIERIIHRSAKLLEVPLDPKATVTIAKRSRKTPRVANRLLKRVRDFAEVKADGSVDPKLAADALSMLAIDEKGLDETDRKILLTIIEHFGGGPVGLNTIASAIAEEMETIEDVYEPFLMRVGFLARTPRGRVVTEAGYRHVGKKPPTGQQLPLAS